MGDDQAVFVGIARVGLHIPEARSLKGKRSHIRSLVDRLRSRHQVLVLEAGHQDLYQRSTIVVCAVSTDRVDLESRLQRVERTVDQFWQGHVLSWDLDVLQL
jgi:uncharacterized protein YlxP (DUF503 family)